MSKNKGWPAQCQRVTHPLRAMLQHWARVLACVAEIPEVSANSVPCSHCCWEPTSPSSAGSG